MRGTFSIGVALAVLCACGQGSGGGVIGLPLPGPDGGVPDAGPDAGPSDEGLDAGQPDAGPPDAGMDLFPLRRSPILDENLKQGSQSWSLSNPTGRLQAYTKRIGALPGDDVPVAVGAATPTDITWELWRVGYYGGAGGRRIASGAASVHVTSGLDGVMDPATGAVSAPWPVAFTVKVPVDAVTGLYLVKVASPIGDTFALFVLREAKPAATILYPVSTNTYQAYNTWGGTSLYGNQRTDWKQWHAYAVSFDRPFQNNGAGEFSPFDRWFIFFAEAQGYDLGYVSDADLDADTSLAARRRMLLFQGHSEYWTANMRQATETAIATGTNVAFLGANSAYWQVRYADASRRLLIGYKEFANLDPYMSSDPQHATTRWRDPPLKRPENAFVGAMFGAWMWAAAPLTVSDPTSWIWKGAGVQTGSIIPGIFADEADNRFNNGAEPAGLHTIGDCVTENHDAKLSYGVSTLYPTAAGGSVFDAGSIMWSRGLTYPGRWDPRIQQATANLFSRFAGDGTLPATVKSMQLPAGLPAPKYRTGVQVSTITTSLGMPTAVAVAPDGSAIVADGDRILRVATNGAVSVVAGSTAGQVDGPAAQAKFRAPRGVAVAANGTIYVSDTQNHLIRGIASGMVWTVAGSQQGFNDGDSPTFSQPMSIAINAAGNILVADAWNHRIREVTPGGVARTWVGTGVEGIQDGSPGVIDFPMGIAVLPNGDAVIAEPTTGVVRTVSGTVPHKVTTVAGEVGRNGWDDGTAGGASFSETLAVGAGGDGQIFLIDGATSRIRALRNGVVDTLAGGDQGGTVDGQGSNAGFGAPRAMATAPDGSIYVVDAREHALRKIAVPR